ncbi:hypothetical protein EC973_000734 [Apophysomyces ossiformis]|uniref:Uncharacterized protein n=1 Tax=Apophysomyces ossiformis TaxID=679940 RepID=A0A8H7BIT2_9FUNG|nr:hypothetical protein EC973_000734 [Apophysomyces ossiformis]
MRNERSDQIRRDIEESLRTDYEHVARMITLEENEDTLVLVDKEDAFNLIEQITKKQTDVNRLKTKNIQHREVLSGLVKKYLDVILDILDTMRILMEKLNDPHEQEKNEAFDTYQATITKALLLRIKTLHVHVLTTTYSKNVVSSLRILR